MKLIFSIDWEDFGQLSHKKRFKTILPPKNQINRQTHIILDLLDKYEVKGTFFILGALAEFRPDLVRMIYAKGHEIALHGYYHDNLPSLSLDQIKKDITSARDLISDITGEKVYGYRAPYFSLIRSKLDVLQILSELGFEYDSSIYPSDFSSYSIPEFPVNYTRVLLPNGKIINELPVSVFRFGKYNVPVSGGGYFRIFNKLFIAYFYKEILRKNKEAMIYMHPYEFDNDAISIEQYRDEGFKIYSIEKYIINFKCNVFRHSIINKLNYLLGKYDFETAREASLGLVGSQPFNISILK